VTDAIRRVTQDDIADVTRLNLEVHPLHARHDPDLFKPAADPAEIAAFFTDLMAQPNNVLGILGPRGAPLGYIWFEHQQKPENPFMLPLSRLYIYHIAVSAAARRQGAGARLMQWAEERAQTLGAAAIALAYMPANEDARRFYERLGFATERVILQKAVCVVRDDGLE
jgi:ribosomal protein S18 acetylase RimI-like enzyme